jgi:quinol monooxygenase YgiN
MRSILALAAALLVVVPAVAQDPPGTALFKTIKEKVGADKPFALLVTAKVKEGTADKFEAAATAVAAATLKEKGCRAYEFFRSTEDPNTFYLIEKWDALPALEAHFKADHLTAFLKAFGEVADGQPKFVVAKSLAPPAK